MQWDINCIHSQEHAPFLPIFSFCHCQRLQESRAQPLVGPAWWGTSYLLAGTKPHSHKLLWLFGSWQTDTYKGWTKLPLSPRKKHNSRYRAAHSQVVLRWAAGAAWDDWDAGYKIPGKKNDSAFSSVDGISRETFRKHSAILFEVSAGC